MVSEVTKYNTGMDPEQFRDAANQLYSGEVADQQAGVEFYNHVFQNPAHFELGMAVIAQFNDLHSNFAALHVLNKAITRSNQENRHQLQRLLLEICDDTERAPIIRDTACTMIAKIALHDYPDHWDSFLSNCVAHSPCKILTEFVSLLNSQKTPSQKRNTIRGLLITNAQLFRDIIFGTAQTIGTLTLLENLLSWFPLDALLNELNISVIMAALRDSVVKSQAIKCLQAAFVDRTDSSITPQILTGVCGAAQNDPEIQYFMSRLLDVHLHRLLPGIPAIDAPEEEISAFRANQEIVKQALLILLNAGWASNDYNDYYDFWAKIFRYLSGSECSVDEDTRNEICTASLKELYRAMPHASDQSSVIKMSAYECLNVLTNFGTEHVEAFLRAEMEHPSPAVLYWTATCLETLSDEFSITVFETLIPFVTKFGWGRHILPCVGMAVCYFQDRDDFIQLLFETGGKYLRSSTGDYVVSALNTFSYMALNRVGLFFANDNALIKFLIETLHAFDETMFGNENLLQLYKLCASVLLQIEDNGIQVDVINHCLSRVFDFVFGVNVGVFECPPEVRNAFLHALDILISFTERCFALFYARGGDIMNLLIALLSAATDDMDDLVERLYDLASVLLASALEWGHIESTSDDCPGFVTQILGIAEQHRSTQTGFVLRLLARLAKQFSECSLWYMMVQDDWISGEIERPGEDTEYALEFMKVCEFWKLGYEFPISLLNPDRYKKLTLDGVKHLLKILKSMLTDTSGAVLLERHGITLCTFLMNLITDSFYSRFRKLQTKVLGIFLIASKEYGIDEKALCTHLCEQLVALLLPQEAVGAFWSLITEYCARATREEMFIPVLFNGLMDMLCCLP